MEYLNELGVNSNFNNFDIVLRCAGSHFSRQQAILVYCEHTYVCILLLYIRLSLLLLVNIFFTLGGGGGIIMVFTSVHSQTTAYPPHR